MCSVSGPIKCRRISFKQLYVLLLSPTSPYAKPKLMPFPNDISPLKESAVFSAAKQIPKQPLLGSLCSNICMQIYLYFLMGAAWICGLWQMSKFYPVLAWWTCIWWFIWISLLEPWICASAWRGLVGLGWWAGWWQLTGSFSGICVYAWENSHVSLEH